MAHSDPQVRERIVAHVQRCGGSVIKADTMPELKQKLGVPDASDGQVDQALRSLTYKDEHKPKGVRLYRPRGGYMGDRPYHVFYVGA